MAKRKIKLTLEVEEMNDPDPNVREGHLTMRLSDCSVIIRDGDKQEVGAVEGVIGGGVELSDKRLRSPNHLGGSWVLSARDIWNAFQAALKDAGLVEDARIL